MVRIGAFVVFLHMVLIVIVSTPTGVQGELPTDHVSVQWNRLFFRLFCGSRGGLSAPNLLLANLNLAQWHALVAVKQTGGCTTPEAVLAFASRKLLANYYPSEAGTVIDPLLEQQLETLSLSKQQYRLAKRLGEAVVFRLINKRGPSTEFVATAVRAAIQSRQSNPAPGIMRFLPNSPHNESVLLQLHIIAFDQPFLVPDPVQFIHDYLGKLRPPHVPSDEWDAAYDSLVNVGRNNWPGRTAALNYTASLYSCPRVNATTGCAIELFWMHVAFEILPRSTPLYDVVETLAKLTVTMHDTEVVEMNIKDGFWFWRPAMAFRAGDPRHAPIPDWTPYAYTNFGTEYPSGTVMLYAAAATVLQDFFGKGSRFSFTIDGNGMFAPSCPGSPGMVIPPRRFASLQALVDESKLGRLYSGAHYNVSVEDGEVAGVAVAKYVLKHWDKTTPSGVMPGTEYLDLHVKLPKKAGDWSPVWYEA